MEKVCLCNEMCLERGVLSDFDESGASVSGMCSVFRTEGSSFEETQAVKAHSRLDFVRFMLTPEDTSAGAGPNARVPAAWGVFKTVFWTVAGVLSLIAVLG